MKMRLISILAATFVLAVGFHGAPAKAGPSVSLAFEGFFVAGPGGFSFAGFDEFFGLGLPDMVIDAMDDDDLLEQLDDDEGYSAAFGLHYEITVNDPSPEMPRNWLLGLDLGIEGAFLTDGGPDLVPLPFEIPISISGIPITDLTGPFSVNDLADLGGLIFDAILDPCGGPPANVIDSDIGACLYIEGLGGPLSGDLFVGFTPDFTRFLLLDLLALELPDETVAIIADFDGEVTLTTDISEPGTLAVLGLGLVAAAFARRRYTR